ncbi:hypothetical protein HYDPIDRAFT_178172 [Hydnomerulius pinastri MD-312]|uniref:Uncharacterized protein n=1 Tax=Hydnomerulius pinastri MD-312 TaxID=994086 RepID=A0A0C2PQX9_9AGAM|nr:hypothetical protein HYDPIDRAFT_178172 [Hydnomerulius pinastri MD-312]
MVGSFHGHAHNRRCQLDWHPMYITGAGRTEGEGCEHVFSSSNELARTTRHATRFHRHQAIEEHFKFWNMDKYAALKATEMVRVLTAELKVLQTELDISDDDFGRFHEQERQHLDGLKQPSPLDQLRIRYVSALDELAAKTEEWRVARETANIALSEVHIGDFEEISLALKRAHARVDSAYEQLQHAEHLVAHIQNQLGLEVRWKIGGGEYNQFKEESKIMKYRAALNELERLVVMRLFELSKLALSGTGMISSAFSGLYS